MPEFRYELKIPKDRIAVLIGKDGSIKKKIEEETKTMLEIDSKEGDVFIFGDDGINIFNACELIKAIGRGFNPEIADLLLSGDEILEVIDIMEFAKTKNDLERLRGRVIGSEGKCRKIVEEMAECYISVYGKTVAIIGKVGNVQIARHAVDSLLNGAPHRNVYKYLEKQRQKLKRTELVGDKLE